MQDLPAAPRPDGPHVAIIMDGNGRWATARGRPRTFGHRAGAAAVTRTVEAAPALGIGTLTLYAFSADNWKRPEAEVRTLMALFRRYLDSEAARGLREGVRLSVIGRRDRLAPEVVAAVERAEGRTASGRRLWLRLAVDYSAREAIRRSEVGPDVDLLVRTGGEKRLSDFLLWEAAYAELVFLDTMWPDFTRAHLAAAVAELERRERRFGGLTAVAAS